MTATKKIPALRFAEFEGEWEEDKIGSHVDFLSGYPFESEEISEINNGPLLMRGVNITEGTIRHSADIDRFFNGNTSSLKKYFVEVSDVVIGMDGSKVGRNSALVNDKNSGSLLVQRVARLRGKNGSSLLYIYQHINSNLFHRYVDQVKTSSGIPHISAQNIKDFTIYFPSLPEQQKIAFFLSLVDDKTQQLTKKKAFLEAYKKGLMQQLFSQQLRFKDDEGAEYPDWEEKKLGEIFTFINTNSFSRSQLNYTQGTVKNIHYGDIHMKFKSNFNVKNEMVPYVNEEIDLAKIPDEGYCKVGDVVIADASEDYNDIGKATEVVNLDNQKVIAGLHTYLARDTNEKMATGFKGYLMQSYDVRQQMMTMATGISVLGISKGNISKVKVKLPVKEEQQKIANILTSIDNKINHVNQQLEKMATFKKGLLQQMFV